MTIKTGPFLIKNLFETSTDDENSVNDNLIFDFNHEYKLIIDDMIKSCVEFGHIDPKKIAVSYTPSKTNSKYGLQAKIYPLRFEGGAREKIINNYKFTIETLSHKNEEIYYIIAFCIPRFLNLDAQGKLETIAHELFHISPRFNGDIRRFSLGARAAHGASKDIFDRHIGNIAKNYLYSSMRSILPKFLYYDYKKLKQNFKEIKFTKLKIPKILREKLELISV
ncbi:MAG: putative metallopeptidase [Candidatus Wallbacteria bacterium]|mgnify:CR=1 FL=1